MIKESALLWSMNIKMRFGSVEFFKVLIKTVLAIVFFLPLVLCIVFGIMLANTNKRLSDTEQKCLEAERSYERISLAAEVLVGERAGSVGDFYEIYKKSGNSDEELIAYIREINGYEEDNAADDLKPSPPETQPVSTPPPPETSAPVTSTSPPEETIEPTEESPYAGIHEDMIVTPVGAEDLVREQGTVYLTFDDGPSQNTYTILSLLRKYDVKATFFVVPSRTDECYALLRSIVSEGHSIGVHSASHDYEKIYASAEAYLEDFYEAWDIIYDATGVKTSLFRFPGGSVNDFNGETRDIIIGEMTRRGFRYFDWNVDSNDAGGASWSEMYNTIPSDIAQNYRSVVLMHDSAPRENTVYVLEDILKVLVWEGYKLDKINDNTMPVQFAGPYA